LFLVSSYRILSYHLRAFVFALAVVHVRASNPAAEGEEVVQLKKQLFSAIGPAKRADVVVYLLRLALQPVESTRHAAVNLLRALASAECGGWGLQLLFTHASAADNSLHANFHLYLQERLTEYSKEGKDWKFSLILAVANNPARSHLPAEVNQKIDQLVSQGAYFLPPRVADMQTLDR
jgi:hypothetical protein